MLSGACSLHVMDVRLLKMVIAALEGGPIPDLDAEAARRCHFEILQNWSHRIAKAAAPLSANLPRERWLLFTQYRPFFITTDDPVHAAELVARLFAVHRLDDVLDFFREEIARLDPDQADAVIDTARQDNGPGIVPHQSAEDVIANLRAYLRFQRRRLSGLEETMRVVTTDEALVRSVGHLLAWRTCNVLANLHPGWVVPSTNITLLAHHPELGLMPLTADPRGMYANLCKRISSLHAAIPNHLSSEGRQTGMCIPPKTVPQALTSLAEWPQPIPSHPTYGAPTAEGIEVFREALIYAQQQHAGLWEAVGLFVPQRGIYPCITKGQAELEEDTDWFTRAGKTDAEPPVEAVPTDPSAAIIRSAFESELAQDGPSTEAIAQHADKSWLHRILKH